MKTEKKTFVECDNCSHVYEEGVGYIPLEDVEDLLERIEPGGLVPAGECTQEDCGALVYPTDCRWRRLEKAAEKAAHLDIDGLEEEDYLRALLNLKTAALEALG